MAACSLGQGRACGDRVLDGSGIARPGPVVRSRGATARARRSRLPAARGCCSGDRLGRRRWREEGDGGAGGWVGEPVGEGVDVGDVGAGGEVLAPAADDVLAREGRGVIGQARRAGEVARRPARAARGVGGCQARRPRSAARRSRVTRAGRRRGPASPGAGRCRRRVAWVAGGQGRDLGGGCGGVAAFGERAEDRLAALREVADDASRGMPARSAAPLHHRVPLDAQAARELGAELGLVEVAGVFWWRKRRRESTVRHTPSSTAWTLFATTTWVCRRGSPAREVRWTNAAATAPVVVTDSTPSWPRRVRRTSAST